jgi:protein-S-isoprenylcysteine O-methyltransferase Ste14
MNSAKISIPNSPTQNITIGWGYLFAATFSINYWDLFGLRQIALELQDKPYTAPEFKEHWMYRYSRHPIMLGAMIGMWCVPEMTATKLILTVTLTFYIFIGVAFEERDLIHQFGDTYRDYKKRVGMFFTF